jgi:hypothetical protein
MLAVLTCCVAPASSTADKQSKKPAEFALVNKAKDIFVVSGRDEPILDYFRRNHILVGGVLHKALGEKFAGLEQFAPGQGADERILGQLRLAER